MECHRIEWSEFVPMNCSAGHQQPEGCLRRLNFKWSDAGRAQYLERLAKPKRYTGDCAVVAVAIAMEHTYEAAREILHMRWKRFHPRENERTEARRGILGTILRYVLTPLPWVRKHEPMDGTPSVVYGVLLESSPFCRFEMIYGEGQGRPSVCLCDPQKVFVIDGRVPSQGESHVTAIKNGAITGDVDVRSDFQVVHIWMET